MTGLATQAGVIGGSLGAAVSPAGGGATPGAPIAPSDAAATGATGALDVLGGDILGQQAPRPSSGPADTWAGSAQGAPPPDLGAGPGSADWANMLYGGDPNAPPQGSGLADQATGEALTGPGTPGWAAALGVTATGPDGTISGPDLYQATQGSEPGLGDPLTDWMNLGLVTPAEAAQVRAGPQPDLGQTSAGGTNSPALAAMRQAGFGDYSNFQELYNAITTEVGWSNPQATTAWLETAMNRALELNPDNPNLSAHLNSGYYSSDTRSTYNNPVNDAQIAQAQQAYYNALQGSNVSNYATGNEMGGNIGLALGTQSGYNIAGQRQPERMGVENDPRSLDFAFGMDPNVVSGASVYGNQAQPGSVPAVGSDISNVPGSAAANPFDPFGLGPGPVDVAGVRLEPWPTGEPNPAVAEPSGWENPTPAWASPALGAVPGQTASGQAADPFTLRSPQLLGIENILGLPQSQPPSQTANITPPGPDPRQAIGAFDSPEQDNVQAQNLQDELAAIAAGKTNYPDYAATYGDLPEFEQPTPAEQVASRFGNWPDSLVPGTASAPLRMAGLPGGPGLMPNVGADATPVVTSTIPGGGSAPGMPGTPAAVPPDTAPSGRPPLKFDVSPTRPDAAPDTTAPIGQPPAQVVAGNINEVPPRGGFEGGSPPSRGQQLDLSGATSAAALGTAAPLTLSSSQQQQVPQVQALQQSLTNQWYQQLLSEGINVNDPTIRAQVQGQVLAQMQQQGINVSLYQQWLGQMAA
jgi:hypothetical protein